MPSFWGRSEELNKIRRALRRGGVGYVTGRRRVGKTALLLETHRKFGGLYHQAVEGTPEQQISHLTEDFRDEIPILQEVTPKSWGEFLKVISTGRLPPLITFDEFPYWVEGDPTLPSILQKWIDHELPKRKTLLLLSGSAQSMLYSQFLHHASPLYGRASLHIHLEPLPYSWFCKAMKLDHGAAISFEKFSLVGGIPHYWKLMRRGPLVEQATELFFDPSAILSDEPRRIVQDEKVTGNTPKAILDLIGRGVQKPSELAARLAMPQGNLSRPLALLLDLGLIHRELPFGESSRSTKKVLYSILDPPLSFYYRYVLPHRTRWDQYTSKEKANIIHQHAALCWENFCRAQFPGGSRYWEGSIEIDLVAPHPNQKGYLVAECKWGQHSQQEKIQLLENLKNKFSKTRLAKKLEKVAFRVFSEDDLPQFA